MLDVQAMWLPMACWPCDQQLLLSDFLHQKGQKFQCSLCAGTWVQRLRPVFLITALQ